MFLGYAHENACLYAQILCNHLKNCGIELISDLHVLDFISDIKHLRNAGGFSATIAV
jgi:hypothetical protein